MATKAPTEKFVITPFRQVGPKLVKAEDRTATSEEGARRQADLLAQRYAGVLAVAFFVDKETGEAIDLREVVRHGEAPELALQ